MGEDPPPPPAPPAAPAPPPTAGEQAMSVLQFNLAHNPEILASRQIYDPQFAKLEGDIRAQTGERSIKDYLSTMETYGGKIADVNKDMAIRADPLGDIRPEYIKAQIANANRGELPGTSEEALAGYRGLLEGPIQDTALLKQLTGTMSSDLASEGRLSPKMLQEAQEGIRTAQAVRGMSGGGSAAMEEALQTGTLAENRRQMAIENAIRGVGLQAGSDAFELSGRSNLYRQIGTEGQQGYANITSLLGLAAPPRLGETTGAFTAGMNPYSVNSGFNPLTMADSLDASKTRAGFDSSIFNTQNDYASSTYGTQMSKWTSSLDQGLAIAKTAGGLAMSGMAMCWVAREVYGIDNPKWLQFRRWMLNDAPSWLRNGYILFGKQIAAFIKDKPKIKDIIRRWMDKKIKE